MPVQHQRHRCTLSQQYRKEIVPGVTLVAQTSDKPVDINVSDDASSSGKARALKDAYNKNQLSHQWPDAHDQAAREAPTTANDSTIMAMQTLRGMISSANGAGDYETAWGWSCSAMAR